MTSRDIGSDIADLMDDGDIRRHIWPFPTREDLEKFTTQFEKAQLKENTPRLGTRVETLEQRLNDMIPTLSNLQIRCAAQDQKI